MTTRAIGQVSQKEFRIDGNETNGLGKQECVSF